MILYEKKWIKSKAIEIKSGFKKSGLNLDLNKNINKSGFK